MRSSTDIGQCIYCGKRDGRLDREQVLPYGMWSGLVLQRASCLECAAKTSAVENRILHEAWTGFRTVLGAPTRRKTGRPETFQSQVRREGRWQEVDLAVTQYTGTAVFPVFGPPAALTTRPDCELEVKGFRVILASPDSVTSTTWSPAQQADAEAVKIPVTFDPRRDPSIFARLIAKVALGYAVELFGPNGFTPTVATAVLGDTDDIGCWVGCSNLTLFEGPVPQGHRVRVGDDRKGGVIAGVQLFAGSGAPEYTVLVGRF